MNHLLRSDPRLAALLDAGDAACHPFVLGELACGGIRNRKEFLSLLSGLPMLPKAEDSEVVDFLERHRLWGKGLGLVDVHLLTSCLLTGTKLWTRDADLRAVAEVFGVSD